MNRLTTLFLRSCILFLLLICTGTIVHAQSLVLKPDDSITLWFGFTEWVLHHAAIPFDSYDLTTFSLLGSSNGLLTDEPPLVLIDGHLHRSTTLINDEFQLPNLDLHTVDSVVISLESEYKNGFYSPSGFIEIFLKKVEKKRAFFSRGLINETNDPGPHINTDFRSPNVEAVNYDTQSGFIIPEIANTIFLNNNTSYTRTNRLIYDNARSGTLTSRTASRDDDGSVRNQRNQISNSHLFNRFELSDLNVSLHQNLTQLRSFYTWNPVIGLETQFKGVQGQHSVLLQNKRTSFFREASTSFSWANYDSLSNANSALEVNTWRVENRLILDLNPKTELLLYQSFEKLEDYNGMRSIRVPLYRASLIHSSSDHYTLSATLGNGEQSVSSIFKNTPFTELSFHTHRKDLQRFNNNLTRWDNQIGLSGSRRPINLTLEPDLINFSSRVGIAQSFTSHSVSGSVRINALHHWELVHADIQYVPAQRGFESTLTYRTHRNIGSGSIQGHFNWQYAPGITFRSVLTVNQVLYANQAFRTFNERVPEVVSSSTINYQYNPNATFELLFKYVSSRFIHEFDGIEEQSDIILPPEVRPIYQLSFSANQYFFSQRLLLSLSLRNLINETISYNTNGQYYDMSVAVKATVRL
ncbi:MAG: hypothetical protein AAFW89_08525 [Bacteroidota bacterium]